METRRTNQFLKVALGARSPARPKYFKGKFYENAKETRLTFPVGMNPAASSFSGKKTTVGGDRPKFSKNPPFTAVDEVRAHTTKDGSRA